MMQNSDLQEASKRSAILLAINPSHPELGNYENYIEKLKH